VQRRGVGEHVEQRAAGGRGRGRVDRGRAGEGQGHRVPVRARRGQRAAHGRMTHLPGGRAVSSAGSRRGADVRHHPGHSDLASQVNGRCPRGLEDVGEFTPPGVRRCDGRRRGGSAVRGSGNARAC
jgi:hypothetical protein